MKENPCKLTLYGDFLYFRNYIFYCTNDCVSLLAALKYIVVLQTARARKPIFTDSILSVLEIGDSFNK